MARTLIQATLNVLTSAGASSPALNATLTPADTANGNMFTSSGRDILIAQNTDSAPHNLSILSAPDPQSRTADITNYSIAAGGFVMVTIPASALFTQTDGNVYFSADNVAVKFLLTR